MGKLETLISASEGDEVVHPDNTIPLDIRPEEWLNPRLLPDLQSEQTRLVAQYREAHAEEIQMREEGRLADECNNHGEMCRSLAEAFRSQRDQMNQSLPRPSSSQRGGSQTSGTNASSAQTLNSLLKAMVSGDGLIDAAAQQAIRQQQQQHLQAQYQQLQAASAKAAAAQQAASSAQSGTSSATSQATLQSQLQQHQQQQQQQQQQQVAAAHQALHIQAQAQHVQQTTQVDPRLANQQRAIQQQQALQQQRGAVPSQAAQQQQQAQSQQSQQSQLNNQQSQQLTAQQQAALKARTAAAQQTGAIPSMVQSGAATGSMPGAKTTSSSMANMAAKMGGAARLQAQMQGSQIHSVVAPQPGTHPYTQYQQQQQAAAAAAAAAAASGGQQALQNEYVPQPIRRNVDIGNIPSFSSSSAAGRPSYLSSGGYQASTATQPMHPQPLVQFGPPPTHSQQQQQQQQQQQGNVYRGPPGSQPQAKR